MYLLILCNNEFNILMQNTYICYFSANVDHRRMSEALCREAETLIQLSGVTHINSIFFGGGNVLY